MSESELVILGQPINSSEDILKVVDADHLPGFVTEQVKIMDDLEKKIKESRDAAGDAISSAEVACGIKVGGIHFLNNGKALERLQEAAQKGAKATQGTTDAVMLMFECIRKVAEIEKILLLVGCSSAVMSRLMIRELSGKLDEGKRKNLSEMARKEIQDLCGQIRRQLDMQEQQEAMGRNIKRIDQQMKTKDGEQRNRDSDQDAQIKANQEALRYKNVLDQKQNETITDHEHRLLEKDRLDKTQSDELARLKTIVENLQKNSAAMPDGSKGVDKALLLSKIAIVLSIIALLGVIFS